MLEIYKLTSLNTACFIAINKVLNIGIIPHILLIFSLPFFFANFVIYYFVACLICYQKISQSLPSQRKSKFWLYYYNLVKNGIIYSVFVFTYAGLKYTVNLPRPFCSLNANDYQTILDTASHRCLSSFPSAHSGLAALILYFLWPYLNNFSKGMGTIIFVLACLSRVALAMHYPSDVISGVIIASLTILVGQVIFKVFKNNVIDLIGSKLFLSLNPKD